MTREEIKKGLEEILMRKSLSQYCAPRLNDYDIHFLLDALSKLLKETEPRPVIGAWKKTKGEICSDFRRSAIYINDPEEPKAVKEGELRECPFCGDGDVRIAYSEDGEWYVFCHSCHCESSRVAERDKVFTVWNTRSTSIQQPPKGE